MIFILDSRSYIVHKAAANIYSWNHLIIPILFPTVVRYQICNIQNNQIIKYFKYIQGKLLLLPSKIFCLLDSFQQLHYNYRKNSNIPLPFQTENKNSLYEQFHTIAVVIWDRLGDFLGMPRITYQRFSKASILSKYVKAAPDISFQVTISFETVS